MSNSKRYIYAGMMIMALLMPVLVWALPNPSSPINVTGTAVNLAEIETIIRKVAQTLIVVSVILAVIFIIWGGIAYMTAGGDETKTDAARARIWNGVVGAAVVLGVGVILQTLAALITRSFFS